MHHVLHQKSILVLHYLILKQKNIGDRGFEFWVFLDIYPSYRVISPGKNKKILSSMWNWVCYPINCNSNFSESTFKEHWSANQSKIRKVKILGKFYYLCKNLSCKSFQTRTQYHFPPFRCYFPYCWCQGEELSFHQTFIKTKTTSNVSATTLVCGVCRCI